MSLSILLPRIGMSVAALSVAVVAVAGLGTGDTAEEGDGGTTPPTTCQPPPATTDGHPWHNCEPV